MTSTLALLFISSASMLLQASCAASNNTLVEFGAQNTSRNVDVEVPVRGSDCEPIYRSLNVNQIQVHTFGKRTHHKGIHLMRVRYAIY